MVGRRLVAILLTVQAVGLIVSLGLFGVTFMRLDDLTTRLQGYAVEKVETYAAERLGEVETRLTEGDGGALLNALADRLVEDSERVEEMRARLVPQMVAFALSEDCGDHCVPAAVLAEITNVALVQRAANLRIGERTARDLVVERYQSTLRGLVQDFRRFNAVNAVAFALMIGLLLARGIAGWRFTAFSVGLLAVTLYMAQWYLFGQNWGRVILFNDWAATAYQGGMVFACLVMIDWLFLRGFFSKLIGNMIGSLGA